MKKLLLRTVDLLVVLLLALVLAIPQNAIAQSHVVSSADLQRDVAAASTARHQNLAQLEGFLSSPAARQALKSAHIDYREVKNAVPQLNNQELARLSVLSQKTQKDFAAGNITNHDLLLILVAIAALILIIVAVR
ncbi:MAG TPA: hypothetical protein VGT03_00840 [Candidatus Acidoferrales bacterium]|nr:hypothetical protein [Candidatus Acidoferrales bacterium]